MFGMSFGELVVLIVVAIVVIGPKDLPKMLGKLGRFAGRMRRMAADLRQQSGIDEILRTEGIRENLTEIRKLARGELDQITEAARIEHPFAPEAPAAAPAVAGAVAHASNGALAPEPFRSGSGYGEDLAGLYDREYPREGADGAGALPDTAYIYTQGLEPSPLARDPLYMTGDPEGELPPDPALTSIPDAGVPPPAVPSSPPEIAGAQADEPIRSGDGVAESKRPTEAGSQVGETGRSDPS